jgi:hypothetical protein
MQASCYLSLMAGMHCFVIVVSGYCLDLVAVREYAGENVCDKRFDFSCFEFIIFSSDPFPAPLVAEVFAESFGKNECVQSQQTL